MKPLVVFGDPERRMIDYLGSTALSATVDAHAPDEQLGNAEWVQVSSDGTPGDDYPVTERVTMRFACYAGRGKRTDVKQLASLVQAYVYVCPGDGFVAGTTPLVGRSDVIADPDTENLMVWFTARVNLKPQPATL